MLMGPIQNFLSPLLPLYLLGVMANGLRRKEDPHRSEGEKRRELKRTLAFPQSRGPVCKWGMG